MLTTIIIIVDEIRVRYFHICLLHCVVFETSVSFFLNDTATTEIYTLSLHDALPICYSKSKDML